MSGQVRRSVVHPTSLPFEAPVIARILLIILAELTLTVSARLRYLGNAGFIPSGAGQVAFTETPIITSPFEAPAWHYELDEDGQPTGLKLHGRRESIQIVPVATARRRGPKQAELALFDEDGAKVTPNALINEARTNELAS